MEFEKLSNHVIGCAIEIHKESGPDLLESTNEKCLAKELAIADISFEILKPLSAFYTGLQLDFGYRVDLLIKKRLIIEIKTVDNVLPIHKAQILTYMKLANIAIGLFIKFNEQLLRNGIKRFVL